MSTPFLLTGVTGGLGAKVLHDLLAIHALPPSSIIATSRSESNRARFEVQGLRFRVADFAQLTTLESAFENVENVLFVSSPNPNTAQRNIEHENVIAAAKRCEVTKLWYVSLAFGGFEDSSRVGFQQAHYHTEDRLLESGIDFVSLRAGVYVDAFPLYLNWYPSSTAFRLPVVSPPAIQGQIAFTSRADLGEGIAALLAKGLPAFPTIKPRTPKNIVLLTAPRTASLGDLIEAVNRARGTDLPTLYTEPEKLVKDEAADDEGGKSETWFSARVVFVQGVSNGDASIVDDALGTLLGREPESGVDAVHRLLTEDRDYTWHQNQSAR